MRDLAARLRAIVRDQRAKTTSGVVSETTPEVVFRSLTYEPEGAEGAFGLAGVAAALGGDVIGDDAAACIAIDRVWDGDRWHGRRRVQSYTLSDEAPLALFEPRLAPLTDWASRVVFFDIETTGLSGGAGTIAFLVGCGWFEGDAFRVRQFFMTGPAGERVLLAALARRLCDASLIVTFNGRTFDLPFMETRWAFHRQDNPVEHVPHFDMLPSSRRLWRWREDDSSCSLSAIERSVLGFHRLGDVPGFEIPVRYFHFLRSGDVRLIEGVLEHNRHDLVSLAAITAHALQLAVDGPSVCREASEQLGLGHLYERNAEVDRALQSFSLAAGAEDRDLRNRALERLAVLLRRQERFEEAAAAWQRLLDGARRPFSSLERRAAEALAIHHEHRVRDLDAARRYAEVVRGQATGRLVAEVDHRLGRIDRKSQAEKAKGGPEAAPLLQEP